MSDALKPPEGWTLYHSIGLLLVSASCIDGELDPDEVGTIRTRLAQYPDMEKGVLTEVMHHYEALRTRGLVMDALDKHCRRLAKELVEDARKVVLDDVIAVIGADDTLHDHERAFLEGVYAHFGVAPPD